MKHINGRITMLGTSLCSEKKLVKLARLIRTLRGSASIGFSVMALSMLAFSARAGNLVINSEFTSSLTFSQSIYNQVTPWVVSASNARVYLYLPGTATTTGATYTHGTGAQVVLTGTGDNSDPFNGNGNFVGFDSGFGYTIEQTIPFSALSANTQYELFFDTAASQQTIASGGFGGATTEYWQVTLGSQTEYLCAGGAESATACSSPLFSIGSQGYSGWFQEEMIFTTPSTIPSGGEMLTFLAVGSPTGLPPFMLLDSVDLQAVPEPAGCALVGVGLLGALFAHRRRKKRA
jgi:hypothetical protein